LCNFFQWADLNQPGVAREIVVDGARVEGDGKLQLTSQNPALSLGTAGGRSSTRIKAASSPARLSRIFFSRLVSELAWTARAPGNDNVFVEWLWRSIKYEEEVCLKAYETVTEARASIDHYVHFYNTRRPYSSLDRKTPDQAYFNSLPQIVAA
jgi:putative transposase